MKKSLKYSILYILFFAFIVVLFLNKNSYHVDELWSYGLANHQGSGIMTVEDGKKYESVEKAFLEYLAVQPDGRFSYQKVWENQLNDNHPVLFYILLHTICSFFPGKFSMWYGVVINLVFAMLLLLYLRKFLLVLTRNKLVRDILSAAFIFSYGILNGMAFIRMYVMTMFWVMALAYCMLRFLDKEQGRPPADGVADHPLWYDLFTIYAVTALSGVTHYYCIEFSVVFSVCAFVYLLCKGLWKGALRLLGTQVLAGLTALGIFPFIIYHLFSGYRGSQSMDNLASSDGDLSHMKTFFDFLNEELFAGFVLGFLAVLLVFSIVYVFRRKPDSEPSDGIPWGYYLILTVPAFVHFIVVSVSADLQDARYLYPVYPLAFCLVFALLGVLLDRLAPERKAVTAVVLALVVAATTVLSYFSLPKYRFEYLFLGAHRFLDVAEEHKDDDCLCIYHYASELPTSYKEELNYKSITFLYDENLDMLDDLEVADNDRLIVRLIFVEDVGDVLDTLLEHYPQYTKAKHLFSYWKGSTYELT